MNISAQSMSRYIQGSKRISDMYEHNLVGVVPAIGSKGIVYTLRKPGVEAYKSCVQSFFWPMDKKSWRHQMPAIPFITVHRKL